MRSQHADRRQHNTKASLPSDAPCPLQPSMSENDRTHRPSAIIERTIADRRSTNLVAGLHGHSMLGDGRRVSRLSALLQIASVGQPDREFPANGEEARICHRY